MGTYGRGFPARCACCGVLVFPMERRGNKMGSAFDDFMQKENDAQIGSLADKVSQLKEISIRIGNHVREDNKLLEGLDNNFDATGGVLKGTMQRLNNMVNSKDSRHMLYLALFVVFVFLFMYKMSH